MSFYQGEVDSNYCEEEGIILIRWLTNLPEMNVLKNTFNVTYINNCHTTRMEKVPRKYLYNDKQVESIY